MTYYAGSWEYAGGNGMQVAMDVTWSTVSHTSTSVTATVKFYTDNQYSYNDNQTLNISSNLGSDYSFLNNNGTTEVLRVTRTYTYTYASGSYGTSPGNVTFSATISGAYNGVTPTVSESIAIPARPAAAPDAPVLTATTSSSSAIALSWTAPDNNGATITGYTLQRSTSSTSGFSTIYTGTARTFTSSELAKATTYYYRVLATNSVGNSAYSTVKSATTLSTVPSVPLNLTATPGVTNVNLAWDEPTDFGGISLSGYKIYRDSSLIGTVGGGINVYNDTTVSPATAYTYTVKAYNATGDSTAASVSTTTIGGIVRIYNGTDWVTWTALPKVWDGTAWVVANARVWNGTEWKYGS